MKLGRWVTNIYDYRKPNAFVIPAGDFGEQQYHMEWVRSKLIGRPKASDTYTVEQLEAMDMIGLYEPAEPTSQTT